MLRAVLRGGPAGHIMAAGLLLVVPHRALRLIEIGEGRGPRG
ncbi:MAG TPA: hypothetical protein VK066_11555 [Chloroflexota bacterium]|nr:hypothetical protein [Chloroflexota bacterium]